MLPAVLIFTLLVAGFGDNSTDVPVTTISAINITEIITIEDVTEFVDATSKFSVNINDTRSPSQQIAVVNDTRYTCGKENACGWKVYRNEGFDKVFEDFVIGPCDCTNNMTCEYYRDDISITSYEYRCFHPNDTSTTSPEALSTDSSLQ
ncbi:hypothetical protein CEXT_363011 [Caerostris extrusa]|uniref:Uncharacterized protein n=1 Tax=Caerostris extrusa TaxID=172846 RepID=A0AAV4NGN7_CAEEX|nr:hypothetical protein CEXT_363011 [Caerostris extrusa]